MLLHNSVGDRPKSSRVGHCYICPFFVKGGSRQLRQGDYTLWIWWIMDVELKIEKRAEWATLASTAPSAHCFIYSAISTLSTLYRAGWLSS